MQSLTLRINTSSLGFLHRMLWQSQPKAYNVRIPESWSEIEAKDVFPCISIIMETPSKQKACLKLLKYFMPLSSNLFHKIKGIDFYEKLIPLVDWMVNSPMLDTPVKGVKFKRETYLMPKARLENMCLWEYAEADSAYLSFLETGSMDYYNRLIAILLRPATPNKDYVIKFNDLREPFHPEGIDHRMIILKDLPENVKFYVSHFFLCCKVNLLELYQNAFEEKGTSEEGSMDWDLVFIELARAGLFGNIEQVKRMPVHYFFKWLQQRKIEEEEKKQKELQDIIQNNHKKFLA